MYLQNYMEFYNIRLFFVKERLNFYETKYYCVFGSVIKMVPKVENFGFLIIFWFVRKKNFRPKFALFWKFCLWFFGKIWKLFQKIFSLKESLHQDLGFGFCLIKIGRLESTFWGGVPLLGGEGGSVARRWKNFPKITNR